MPNRPIPVDQARAMIKDYTAYMQTLGVDMKKQTEMVAFSLPELMKWLTKISSVADEIRICMGDYPDGHAHAGRTTVILWPYKNGAPAQKSTATALTPLNTDTDPEEGGDDDNNDDENGNGGEDGGGGGGEDPYNEGTLYP